MLENIRMAGILPMKPKNIPHKKKKGLKNSCFRCIVKLCEHLCSAFCALVP